jgi:hypothetical protein
MSLAGREAELHRQVIGVHDGVNLARKPASRVALGQSRTSRLKAQVLAAGIPG